jgi:hypothetical protein
LSVIDVPLGKENATGRDLIEEVRRKLENGKVASFGPPGGRSKPLAHAGLEELTREALQAG